MPRISCVRPSLVAAAVVACLGLGVSVGAEGDAPAGAPPAPLAKAAVPFFEGLLGTWDATVTAQGRELPGTDRWSKILDGTAYLHELHLGEGPAAFDGMGVLRVGPDGKAVTMWWFDSMGQGGVWKFQGTVTAEGFEVASDEGGMKATKALRKSADGLAYAMTVNGAAVASGTWKKAAKDAPAVEPKGGKLGEHPLIRAELGEWTVKGRMGDKEHSGTSRFRLAVGGHYLVQEYDVRVPVVTVGFGLSSLGADGASMKTWWFSNYVAEPMAIPGTVTATEWRGRGEHPLMGEMRVTFTKTDAGFEGVYSQGERELFRETYTRKE